MRIGIPIWGSRISPLFDTARTLLLAEVADNRDVGRTKQGLEQVAAPQRAMALANWSVGVLLCGAISRPLAGTVSMYGIEIISWLSGDVEEVLQAFLDGRLSPETPDSRFMMPGCRPRARRFRGRRGRWGRM